MADRPLPDGAEGPEDLIVFERIDSSVLRRFYSENQEAVDAVPTPFPSWNAVSGEEGGYEGIAKSWTVVIGGAPGQGKTYLALNIAAHAVMAGKRVGNINFEMSQKGMAMRFAPILTGVPKKRLEARGKKIDEEAWATAQNMIDEVYEKTGGALISNESTVFSLADIEESYQVLVEDMECDVVIVDYVQLVNAPEAGSELARAWAVANLLRDMSKRYNVVTIAVSQINRDGSKRDGPPKMSDLYGGTAWDANANQILLLNHNNKIKRPALGKTFTELVLVKNRHGLSPVAFPVAWNWDDMTVEEFRATDDFDPFVDEEEPRVVVRDGPESWAQLGDKED